MVDNVTNGTLTFVNGEYSYSPKAGFTGKDSFTFEVSDGSNASKSKVTFDVQEAPPEPTTPSSNSSGGSINYLYLMFLLVTLGFRSRYYR